MTIKNRKKHFRKARQLESGLETHPQVPILHVPVNILTPLIQAGTLVGREFQRSRELTSDAHSALAEVKRDGIAWATKARDTLKPFLGTQWSIGYATAGFTLPSLAIPQSVGDLGDLITALTASFEEFPKRAQSEAGVTADSGAKLAKRLEAAGKALSAAEVDQRTKRDAREAADAKLAEKITLLLKELDTALQPTDPRWLDFIGDIPGDPQRPEAVEELTGSSRAPGELDLEFNGGLRAERHLVEVMILGQDTEFRRVVTVRDEDARLTGLPPGAEVKVRVIGMNKVGAGPASAVVTVKVAATPTGVAA